MNTFLSKREYTLLYILLAIVYFSGLWIPLMENDSAQHATMAMRMYLENDFLNIYKGDLDYLDKPHLHFWLSALSFKVFGISQWSYRIPALLFTILGAYSCNRLAKELYSSKAAHVASMVFLTGQAIFLANHDVRTDAVLTGATIFGIWQLVMYINHNKIVHAIFGGIGVALAFSSKGQLGVFVSGICILSYLIYNRKWKSIWSVKTIAGILAFVLVILPVLYAYYVQFDLHPEKVIHGQSGVSGVRFILWDQSFNRLTGSGFEPTGSDYFFFFHTLLWAFLPWSLVTYIALFSKIKLLISIKFRYQLKTEILTSVGFIVVMIVISFSKFKLPHYLNSLLPVLSVLVAGYLLHLYNLNKTKVIKNILRAHYFILTLGSTLVLFLIFWAFSMPNVMIILCYLILITGLCYVVTRQMNLYKKLVLISICFMILINFCLNTQFYPKLLQYQAGNTAAKIIETESIDPTRVFILEGKSSWSLNFNTHRMMPVVGLRNISKEMSGGDWLFLYNDQLQKIKETGVLVNKKYEINHYRITKLTSTFLNPNTRDNVLEKAFLIQIK